ncbi:hypothetical protein [Nocardioides yefusunii]|uniref:Uncharacterized protein n=1 Tax=Nocardioides yefusunii TaxID=2500546 RepID=A0ABW1R274_9ACTN|nr:hypothetical protein [Nocardioides yefusunii]
MISANEFLPRFFGEGNNIWPGVDPQHAMSSALSKFLDALEKPGECPVILPRQILMAKPSVWYVIAHDTAHVERVRLLLQATVAHSWVPFNGRVAHLTPSDPVDRAVLDFRGPGTTFVLKPSTPEAERRMVWALRRLATSLAGRELRVPSVPRPVGRMLKEFELHLATDSVAGSARILSEIESAGGISHENIAFLRLRRLAQLGLEEEVLSSPSLPSLVYSEPPFLVREAVLGAWARHLVLPVLEDAGNDAACEAIISSPIDIAMLVDARSTESTDTDVARVSKLVLAIRASSAPAPILEEVTESATDAEFEVDEATPSPTPTQVTTDLPECGEESMSEGLEEDDALNPEGWLDWVAAIAEERQPELDLNVIGTWTPAWGVDTELAAAINDLPSLAEDSLISGVAALLHTDDADHPAPRTARALIDWYLVTERFTPLDLSVLCRLLQIVIRSSPNEQSYNALLGDIRAYADRWVSVSNAVRVIDIADAVACGPAGEARDNFVSALLSPLNHQRTRLPESMRTVADFVTSDLEIALDWQVPGTVVQADQDLPRESITPRILLYSLDSGTLGRSEQAISKAWPEASVDISDAKVGNDSLKQLARNSDIVIMATRRATHAATNFIIQNLGGATHLEYADGSGSASMIRAVEAGISAWAG